MSENWNSYTSAPAEGAVICDSSSVPEDGTFSVELDGIAIILVRSGGRLVAYVNACPHQFLPLDYRSSSAMSADGRLAERWQVDLASRPNVERIAEACQALAAFAAAHPDQIGPPMA